MKLPKNIELVIEMLEENGYEAVVVGGALRDFLLGKVPHDYDISTNATPEEVKEVFHNYYTLDTGIKHGTITIFFNHQQIEITSFRVEEDYEDFRHPKKVVFVQDLKQDLSRRDFTMNAICFNKEIIDYVDGIKDLNLKIIRAIGNPKHRFLEDPLRILRALRFASTLGFEIEENTKQAMFEYSLYLDKVSKERINVELSKLLLGINASNVINEYFSIFKIIIPDLDRINLNNTLSVFDNLKGDLVTCLAALLLDLGSKSSEVLKTLKFSNRIIKEVEFLIENIDLEVINDEYHLKKLLVNMDLEHLIKLIEFKAYYYDFDIQSVIITLNKISQQDQCFNLKELNISGSDLLNIGYKQGVIIRITLEKILDDVIKGKLKNEKEDLLNRAKQLYKD